MTEQQFDVFLCHSTEDKPAVIQIAQQLQQKNLKPWLDVWALRPGLDWQDALEEQIESIGAAAVFVGSSGLGPWQNQEIKAFLRVFSNRPGCPIIPVLLPNAPKEPQIPLFLGSRHWVDFRTQDPDPLGQLLWGITGVRFSAPLDTAQPQAAPVGWAPPTTPQPQPSAQAAHPTFEFETITITGIEKTGFFGQGAPNVITRAQKGQAEYHREDLGNGITLDLVKIPGGRFQMGALAGKEGRSGAEGPQHSVTVPEFWLGKYAVTQAQYQAVMGANLSRFTENGANRPVEQVSWQEAVAFCEKLSQQTGRTYRLPSEAEWEYACRAGTTTPFYFGPTMTTDLANYQGTDWEYEGTTYPGNYGQGPHGVFRETTTEVGSFPPNAFGLYDMHGNVLEWCADHWHDNYDGAPTNGTAWLSSDESARRLLRGGSWYYYPRLCRSANRISRPPAGRSYSVGFRVVCAAARAL